MTRPTNDTLERMKTAAGPGGWTVDADEIAPHLVEWRERWTGSTPLLLKPSTVASVAEIVRIAAGAGTALVPQGGNTGLVGGQIPSGEVLL
ncbi:MAG: FAD-binding oxidoreductase, partial [Alphaproteobacteria bacterium]|nr:FAD-binding oxidoreductase [Alphaproteobacteria bacterium]